MDKYSRRILRYIKRKGHASFDELLKLGPNESLCAQILLDLNVKGYTIQVGSQNEGKREAIYELHSKGYTALEEYFNHMLIHTIPIIISICVLIVSTIALFRS